MVRIIKLHSDLAKKIPTIKDDRKVTYEGLIYKLQTDRSFLETVLMLYKSSKLVLKIIYYILKIKRMLKMDMKSKTTKTAIIKTVIAAIVAVISFFVELPADIVPVLTGAIVAVWGAVDLVQGIFTKDDDGKEATE